jgi:hypothetical protein
VSHIRTPTAHDLPHLHLIASIPISHQIKKPYLPRTVRLPRSSFNLFLALVRFDPAMAKVVGSGETASAVMAAVMAPVAEVEGQGDAAPQSAKVEAVAPVMGAKRKRVAEEEGSGGDASAAMAAVVAPIAEVEGQGDETAGTSDVQAVVVGSGFVEAKGGSVEGTPALVGGVEGPPALVGGIQGAPAVDGSVEVALALDGGVEGAPALDGSVEGA